MLFGEPYSEFDRIGAQAVEENLALGRYGDAKAAKARLWLEDRRMRYLEAQDAEKKTIIRMQLDVAASAKDAAWEAVQIARTSASEAKEANTISRWAVVVALLSILVTAVSIFAGE